MRIRLRLLDLNGLGLYKWCSIAKKANAMVDGIWGRPARRPTGRRYLDSVKCVLHARGYEWNIESQDFEERKTEPETESYKRSLNVWMINKFSFRGPL